MERACIKDKIIYTNIQEYKVDDGDCQNLCLKSILYGVSKVLVCPSSVEGVQEMVKGKNVEMGVAISYPSGAYFPEAKEDELREMVALFPALHSVYAVMAVGRFLSGYEKETMEEMQLIKKAAGSRKTYIFTETSVLGDAQLKKICDIAVDCGINGIVSSTGFMPYDVPLPTTEDLKRLALAAGGRLQVIANGMIDTFEKAQQALDAGADLAMVTKIDYLA